MMLTGLALHNGRRQLLRTVLTVAAVSIAVVTFVLLRTVISMWAMGDDFTAKDRIATRHKATFVMTLPLRYLEEVRSVDGVVAATPMNWFGGKVPGREQDFFSSMATDGESMLKVHSEIVLPDEQRASWLANRQGAVVGRSLADKFGWKIGDRVNLEGALYPGEWTFVIEGIYTASKKTVDLGRFFFHYALFNEKVRPSSRDQIGWIVSRVEHERAVVQASERIDAHFDDGEVQTRTMSEHALSASFLGMMSAVIDSLGVISFAVFAILLLILGNTIAMGVRERTREFGVLLAMGFVPQELRGMIVAEALFLGLVGGVTGLVLSAWIIDGAIGPFVEASFASWFPYFRLQAKDAVLALLMSGGGATVVALVLSYGVSRMGAAQALRRVA